MSRIRSDLARTPRQPLPDGQSLSSWTTTPIPGLLEALTQSPAKVVISGEAPEAVVEAVRRAWPMAWVERSAT